MTKKRSVLPALTGVVLLAAACSGQPTAADTPTSTGASGPEMSKMLFIGDSVAVGEALPLAAALEASDVEFQSLAAEGGGNVVGPSSDNRWKELPDQIASANPSTVIYQITTYDWGSKQQQQAAYEKLVDTVSGAGAKLVFVTMPPITPDDFYRPHMSDLERAPDVARTVAAGSSGEATFLDASAVWGDTYQRLNSGEVYRSTDGIHTCQQGAAHLTDWLLGELAKLYPDFTPAQPQEWANTGWAADPHFKGC